MGPFLPLAGCLRMGTEGARDRASEVVPTDRVEFVAQFHRAATGLDHGPGGTGPGPHVGVGSIGVAVPVRAGDFGLSAGVGEPRRTDVPVAVPGCSALIEADPVHHAVADEPVVARRIHITDGIRSVAQVATRQLGGQFPDDGQIELGDLIDDRREVARQIRAGRGFGFGLWCTCHAGEPKALATPTAQRRDLACRSRPRTCTKRRCVIG